MKAFRFRLQAVLTLRDQAEQVAQQRCARAYAAVENATARVRSAEAEIDGAEHAHRAQLAAAPRAGQLEQLRAYAGLLHERRRQLARELAEARRELLSLRLVLATQPELPGAPEVTRKYIRIGASPRGAQALTLAGRVNSLMDGRVNLSFEDVRLAVHPALRHRISLNFEAEARGLTVDAILDQLVGTVPEMSQ